MSNDNEKQLNNNSPPSLSSSFVVNNKFANDGSFMEIFKKMQQKCQNDANDVKESSINETKELHENVIQSNNAQTESSASSSAFDSSSVTSPLSLSTPSSGVTINNKRRPKTLKVGVIKRQRKDSDDEEPESGDAWKRYMTEVKKYKDKYGDDGDKNRPLVK